MACQPTAERKYVFPLILCLLVLLSVSGTSIQAQDIAPDIEVFVRSGCPHCEAAKVFLDDLQRERPELQITFSDIAQSPATRQRLALLVQDRGLTGVAVPTFLIGTELIVGFRSADTTGAAIRGLLDRNAQAATYVRMASLDFSPQV